MRIDLAAVAADPGDVVETGNALVQHYRNRTLRGQAIDDLPVAGRNGLLDIDEAKESERLEIVERLRLGPSAVCVRSDLDLVAEFDPQRGDPMQILGKVTGGDAHLQILKAAIDIALRLREKRLLGRDE